MTDQFGRTITSNDNGDGTTTYTASDGTVIVLPTAYTSVQVVAEFSALVPTVPPLAYAHAQAMTQLRSDQLDFVGQYFNTDTKLTFLVVYENAKDNGLTNRAAYLKPLMDWVSSLIAYAATVSGTITAASSTAAVQAVNWDFQGNVGAPPNVTLVGAGAITN